MKRDALHERSFIQLSPEVLLSLVANSTIRLIASARDRAAKRRQIAKDVMVELDLKKLSAPDFTASIRPGTPALMVIDEAAVPSIYWEPREPRLNRQELANDLKQGAEIAGVALSNPEPVLSVRTK
jgi:hypothetical protein